jgi:hypothetical protein
MWVTLYRYSAFHGLPTISARGDRQFKELTREIEPESIKRLDAAHTEPLTIQKHGWLVVFMVSVMKNECH